MVSEIQYSGMLKMYMKESQIGCKVNKSTNNANKVYMYTTTTILYPEKNDISDEYGQARKPDHTEVLGDVEDC